MFSNGFSVAHAICVQARMRFTVLIKGLHLPDIMPPKVEAFTRCTHIQKTDTQRVRSGVVQAADPAHHRRPRQGQARCYIPCMMVVDFYHLLCLAVEHPLERALCRPRRAPLLCERLLDGSGTTAVALPRPPVAQGHDSLSDVLGRCGRGGPWASARRGAPGGSCCQGALAPWVAPTVRAGPCPAEGL